MSSKHTSILNSLRNVDPDALLVVRSALESRVGSAMTKTDNLALRGEVRRAYALLSRLIDNVRNDVDEEDITKVSKPKAPKQP